MQRIIGIAGTGALIAALAAAAALASSHREAPLISLDQYADNTDTYIFRSPDAPSTVTIIACFSPAQEPGGGPNFYGFDGSDFFSPSTYYEIHIDNDGDCVPDIDYSFAFRTTVQNQSTFLYNTGPIDALDDPDWNVRQTFFLVRYLEGTPSLLGTDLPVPPVNIGPASTPDYEALWGSAVRTLAGDIKVFAGQTDDPFWVDLGSVFDLLTIRPGAPGNAGGGLDGLSGFNVLSVALQVPITALTRDGSAPTDPDDPAAVIGAWASSSRRQIRILRSNGAHETSGANVHVSRLGMPLVNEVLIPLQDKDKWNASFPVLDAQFQGHFTDPEPAALLNAIHGVNVPPVPRNDIYDLFMLGIEGLNRPPSAAPCEQLRLNVAIPPAATPNRFGVLGGDQAGFPNGRRLEDDIVDIELRALAGVLVDGFDVFPNNALGDGTDANDVPYRGSFPYLALPHAGFDHAHGHEPPPGARN